ncbi:MAG: hypothetical protein KDJ65_33175 [Anaerolineae bacterium]|nr:hypothetical protein [Anaerolineae bacterium]
MSTKSNEMIMASVQNRASDGSMPQKRYRLTKYLVSAGLGVVAGGLGVTVVMGCIICIQLFYITNHMFFPDPRMVTIAATVMGAGISWLLYRALRHFSPFNLLRTLNQEGLRVILIFSVLTSLLETFLYMQNMFTGIATNSTYAWV